MLAAAGYPEKPRTGDRIDIPPVPDDVLVFHAGTKRDASGKLVTAGGRVLAVTGRRRVRRAGARQEPGARRGDSVRRQAVPHRHRLARAPAIRSSEVPELPETETIARDLDREIAGTDRRRRRVTPADVLREVTRAALAKRVVGRDIERCLAPRQARRPRPVDRDRIVVQPRFTGALLIDAGDLPDDERRTRRSSSSSTTAASLHYRDIRRLGTVALMDAEGFARVPAELGVEPLDRAFTAEHLSVLLRGADKR